MINKMLIFSLIIVIAGCAGIQVIHTTSTTKIDKSGKYIVFPFRDPSFKDKEFPGVGARFTNAFASACGEFGLNATPVFTDEFKSTKDINILDAIAYAKKNNFKYMITGQITKWVDRATEWSGKRDFAGLSVSVREVDTGNLIFSSELQEHSNIFWSGIPDDFISSLSRAMAAKMLGIEILNKSGGKNDPSSTHQN